MNRPDFLSLVPAAAAFDLSAAASAGGAPQSFRVARRRGRWWFVTPQGEVFFSLALNHIDASPLRYTSNGDLWQRKYGNSMEGWLKESLATELSDWGFKSVALTQEVVTRGLTNHRHSRAFTLEKYQGWACPIAISFRLPTFISGTPRYATPIFKPPNGPSGAITSPANTVRG
jgi:hypothetical protein